MSTSRNRAAIALLSGCVGCGESRIYTLAIHHKNADRTNNRADNLEVVCGRCHSVRHLTYHWENNYWLSNNRVLTPRLVVDYMDKQTREPYVLKQIEVIHKMQLDYLSRYAEDAENGTDFDHKVLNLFAQLELDVKISSSNEDYDVIEDFG